LFQKAINSGWNPTINPLIINGYVINAFILAEKPNIRANLSSESLRRSPLINIVERSPAPILLPNVATLLK